MKLAFVAQRVARVGGMERAAAEVSDYLSRRHDFAVVTTHTDLSPERVEKRIISLPKLPALLNGHLFRAKARREMRTLEPSIFLSIGAAAWPVDVMVVQFCHAAFWNLPMNVRPKSLYQRLAAAAFVREEATAIRSPRLKGMIAVSNGAAQEMMRYYGYPAERIKVVPNGVHTDIFCPIQPAQKLQLRQTHGIPEDKLVAIFVGGDWTRKGLGFAIDAMRSLSDWHLLVVGGGGRERAGFIRKAADAGLQDRVTFFGRSEKPWELYQMADACVQPTSYEAFSLVSLEAAATGLPLLIPDVNGAVDLIKDGYNGFICDRTTESIVDRLAILSRAARRSEMSFAAREVSLDFAWSRIGERFEKALLELM
jgi:UDP-glucose:(heptosyl)LPS alpha-1,3-glucosyltransferase